MTRALSRLRGSALLACLALLPFAAASREPREDAPAPAFDAAAAWSSFFAAAQLGPAYEAFGVLAPLGYPDVDAARCAASAEALAEGGESSVEPGEVLVGISRIVHAGAVEMVDRDQRPQRFAQQRRGLHGGVAAQEVLARRTAEIGFEQQPRLLRAEIVVRAQIGEVEHRGAEAGIFVVDQPEPRAVVDEVGGEQVVVAGDDRQRHLRRLELGVHSGPLRQWGFGVTGLA